MVHFGINQPVVAAFHALLHAAFQPCQRIRKKRLLGRAVFEFQSLEAIGARFEGLEKLFQQSVFASLSEHIESEAIALVQQRFHRTILGDGTVIPGGVKLA